MSDIFETISKYGIATIGTVTAKSASEAKDIADKFGYPVVLKISSQDPVHKTDIGCVKIGVEKEYVESVFSEIMENAKKANIRYDGVIVQEQAKPGLEMIIGLKQDLQFGPTILIGLGGIYAEVIRDFSIRICPITPIDAKEMIDELKYKAVLTARGKEYDKESLLKILMSVNEIAMKEDIKELDLNPVVLYPKGSGKPYVVVDARVVR